jgi:ABC-type lipoprotein release transport system permease subunit
MFLVYLAQAACAGLIGVAIGCPVGWAIAWFLTTDLRVGGPRSD